MSAESFDELALLICDLLSARSVLVPSKVIPLALLRLLFKLVPSALNVSTHPRNKIKPSAG